MKVIRATINHLEQITPLFDGYRVFYKQASDVVAANNFLMERFQKNDSVILLAVDAENAALGFTQLYPSFSSVALQRVYILNDVYVRSESRGIGVGEALMESAKAFAISQNARGLTLETDIDNPAQKLYERLGWVKDSEVFHYTWEV